MQRPDMSGRPGWRPAAAPFTMLEVVLGLGLIALGLVAMVGLIPAGLKTNRDAAQQTEAAYNAEQFICFLSAHLKDPTDDYANWDDYGRALPTSKPSSTEPTSWTPWINEAFTRYTRGGGANQFYRAEHGDDGSGRPEFVAVYRVWRQPVTLIRDDGGSMVTRTLSDEEAIAIYAEVSWPVHVPYAAREKAVFHFEVFRN